MTEQSTQVTQALQQLNELRTTIQKIYLGQAQVVDQILIALLAGGHVLLEGVPGLGKTLLVKTLAQLIDSDFSRIQFTPDLMPADVTGHILYDHQSGLFKTNKGPVFTNLLLADEINRSPAKTQAALLEVMEEQQVTLDGNTMQVGSPFMVLATQNPIEQEGTYNLPEAQLDRFLMKINIDYPERESELDLLNEIASGEHEKNKLQLSSQISRTTITEHQLISSRILVDRSLQEYIINISQQTREHEMIRYGVGPRGGISLLKCAQAYAMLQGRDYVIPDDIKVIVLPALRHRIILSPEYELSGVTNDEVLNSVIEKIAVPRE